jgi:diacylglycerol O-acyltransferase
MATYAFERLSAQDAGFLWAETPNQPMHVGALAIFEAGPLVGKDGGIDIERYRRQVESILHWIPRYRQKIDWTPIETWPIWIDDRNFDIGYHIRHIALPRPGTTEQLKELSARINARRLDRQHALWEIWVIEGVAEGAQFAILNKIHHCMIDGAAGADLSQILMSPSKNFEETEPVPYMPRPKPSRMELLADSVSRGISRPLAIMREGLTRATSSRTELEAASEPSEPTLEARLGSLAKMAETTLRRASPTPLNGPLGPHRRLDWLTLPLDDVKELGQVLGCTINDVVLATVTGAIRRYLFRRRVDHRTVDFRVSTPVSTRKPEHDRRQGNHVSSWVVPLPLDFEDPIAQIDEISRLTEDLKATDASLAVDTIMSMAEWIPGPVLARALGSIGGSGPVNMIVTNVPGPQFPLYLAGAKLLAMYPIVPLIPGGGLGIALFSYEGKLCWGFNGDYELIPDLPAFKSDVQTAFEALRKASVDRYLSQRTAQTETEAKAKAPKNPKRRKKQSADTPPIKVSIAPEPSDTAVTRPSGKAPAVAGAPVASSPSGP